MGLCPPPQPVKVSLAEQLRSSAVLTDMPALVDYGTLVHVCDPALSQTVVADIHKSISQLVGV